ncbi:hypothetical protein ACFSX9_15470 [Flavobacterium ardleyense]|uniref:Replication restart DNA helicase PriA n=1 Tax=Flavobacterium ardleyense TaxID=2038737 RepID=A0ABW5ZB48_9FLAO
MSDFKEFPCPNCSSELNYDAEKNDLKCLHCHTVFSIEKSDELIAEITIDSFNSAISSHMLPINDVNYKCSKCGQETKLKEDIAFFECRNCGNNVINASAYKSRTIVPSSIIPFAVSKDKAMEHFIAWIGKGFWNDSSLKELSIADNLVGHYIPFWTFDANTENQWSGQSGTYYYVTESYRDSQGKSQTRSVRRTRWQYKEGQFSQFFNDILICGNQEITQDYINKIYPFHLDELKPLNEKYLLGWNAKAFDKDMNDSYTLSKNFITSKVEEMAATYLAADTYSGLEVSTEFCDETYKHIILPVWFCEYLFKDKKYFFIINGQTGAIHGEKPLSTTKIVTAIVLAVIFVIVLFMAFS